MKVWDVLNDKQCRRTYTGHTAGVREVNFDNDGKHFTSLSLDKTIKIWDTETGKCLQSLYHGSTPQCCVYYPEDNNVLLVGSANKKILQYDLRMNTVSMNYEYHQGAVNTITFYDENKHFVTSGDDRKVIAWDFHVSAPIRIITDATLGVIPYVYNLYMKFYD